MPGKIRSISQLETELRTKQRQLRKLRGKRQKLAAQIERIDRVILQLVGAAKPLISAKAKPPRARRRRRRAGKALVSYIQDVLAKSSKGMRAVDVAAAVREAGYKSVSKDFYRIVAATLRDTTKFKRLKRGVYALA